MASKPKGPGLVRNLDQIAQVRKAKDTALSKLADKVKGGVKTLEQELKNPNSPIRNTLLQMIALNLATQGNYSAIQASLMTKDMIKMAMKKASEAAEEKGKGWQFANAKPLPEQKLEPKKSSLLESHSHITFTPEEKEAILQTQGDIDELKEDIAELKDELGDKVLQALEARDEMVDQFAKQAMERLGKTGENVSEKAEEEMEKGQGTELFREGKASVLSDEEMRARGGLSDEMRAILVNKANEYMVADNPQKQIEAAGVLNRLGQAGHESGVSEESVIKPSMLKAGNRGHDLVQKADETAKRIEGKEKELDQKHEELEKQFKGVAERLGGDTKQEEVAQAAKAGQDMQTQSKTPEPSPDGGGQGGGK